VHGALFAGHWARHQLVDKPLQLAERAQDAKAELLQQRFVFIETFAAGGRTLLNDCPAR
jgi:hypothetical protein